MRTTFGVFGGGVIAFPKLLLGKLENRSVRQVELEKIAGILYGEVSEEEKLDMYRKEIEKHGVDSREEFLGKGVDWFIQTTFGVFGGGGKAFPKLILGKLEKGRVRKVEFEKIADKLYPIK